jgi:hypothetical protein
MGKLTASASSNWHVILHEDLEIVQECQEVASEWLKEMGLELKPSKTRITHTLTVSEGEFGNLIWPTLAP